MAGTGSGKSVGVETVGSFLKSIAKRLSKNRADALADRVRVAAFGKHPGWDDHIEDVGLETEMLVAARRLIYVQGVGENIEQGTWEKLQEDQRLAEFRHGFVWYRQGDIVAGHMWSSQDGRGRKSYPMVVCVHACELPVDWVCERLLPCFEAVEAQCKQAKTAAGVRACLVAFQRGLRELVRAEGERSQSLTGVSQALSSVAALPEMGPGDEGLMRILYHLDREAAAYAAARTGKNNSSGRVSLRVPVSPGRVPGTAVLWLRFLLARFGKGASVLVFMPTDEAWIDLIVGEPTPSQLYCLRALPGAVPLTSDVPYHISQEFMEQVRKLLAG